MADTLDIRALERAVVKLEEGLTRYRLDVSDEMVRDGLIQRFEFVYELSHKTLKRYLEYTSPSPELFDEMPFQDLIRSGNEHGLLLGDWPVWREYRKLRGKTSHTYDEKMALEVVQDLDRFLEEVRYLRDQLRAHLK